MNIPVAAWGHMPFANHRSCAQWGDTRVTQPLVVFKDKALAMTLTHSQAEIARHFRVSPSAVCNFYKRHNIPPFAWMARAAA